MSRDVLVLNKAWCAVQIADWKKIMSLLYQDQAVAVDDNLQTYNFNDWVELSALMTNYAHGFVNTTTLRIAIPEVVRLVDYDKLPKTQVKFTRRNIYEHYNNTCCYCGVKKSTKDLNLDHVLPRSRGGKTSWDNVVLSCIPCNSRKDDRLPSEAGMPLLVKPSKPRWRGVQVINVKSPVSIPVSWQRLLDQKYWSTELESM